MFHPSGRAALAARHGSALEPDEPLAAASLQRSTLNAGWQLTTYDDAESRFLAIATRAASVTASGATPPRPTSLFERHTASGQGNP